MSIMQDILMSAIGSIPGIALAMWIGYKRGIDSKRPPKPRPHAHDWGRWERYLVIEMWTGIPLESNRSGFRYYTSRECSSCGKEQHDIMEVEG